MPNVYERLGIKPPEQPAAEATPQPGPNSPLARLAATAGVSPQELIAMRVYPVEINGRSVDIEAASPEEAARKAYTQFRLEQRQAKSAGYLRGQEMAQQFLSSQPPTTPPTTSPFAPVDPAPLPERAAPAKHPWMVTNETARAGLTDAGEPINEALVRRGRQTLADVVRTGSGLVTAPLLPIPGVGQVVPGAAGAAGEAAAQYIEGGEISSPGAVAFSGLVPPAVQAGVRGARALGRTATRLVPQLFQRGQGAAVEAADEMVNAMRPTTDLRALAESARAAGGDLVGSNHLQRAVGGISLPPTPANPKMAAVQTTIDNLRSVMKPGGQFQLADLEAVRRDIGPLLKNGPAELRGIYGAIVKDLEASAEAGGVGASLARETATAFKQDLGATRVAELIEKATSVRTINGADVPALNVSTLVKLTRKPETRRELMQQLGPDGLRPIDEFVRRFRSLPPDMAYNAWNRMLFTLGGGLSGGASIVGGGDLVSGGVAAVVGALTPEVLTNMALVGKNPQQLNRLMVTVSQGLRTGALERGETDR
jgi:hypothetical protein